VSEIRHNFVYIVEWKRGNMRFFSPLEGAMYFRTRDARRRITEEIRKDETAGRVPDQYRVKDYWDTRPW
jgi:hypothetical protein